MSWKGAKVVTMADRPEIEGHVRRRIRRWQRESGLTQAEMGEVIEWEQQTVSNFYAGKQFMDIPRLMALLEFFNYTMADLLSIVPPRQRSPEVQKLKYVYRGLSPEERTAFLERMEKAFPAPSSKE